MMNNPPLHFLIQSRQQVWSTVPNLSESSFDGWLRERAKQPHSTESWVLTKPEATAQRAKLDSDKPGDEAGDQTDGLIGSCTSLKVFDILLMLSVIILSILNIFAYKRNTVPQIPEITKEMS